MHVRYLKILTVRTFSASALAFTLALTVCGYSDSNLARTAITADRVWTDGLPAF